jgi:hypothetical protein
MLKFTLEARLDDLSQQSAAGGQIEGTAAGRPIKQPLWKPLKRR